MLELTPKRDTAGLFSLSRHPQGPPLTGEPFGDPTASVKRSDLALVLHTSGTTKKPKIVPLTHENICSGCQCIMSTIQCGLGDVNINIMPLFHIHGLIVNVMASALSGSQCLAVGHRFDSENFHKGIHIWPEPTWYSAVPTMHLRILKDAEEEAVRLGGKPRPNQLELLRNCSAALLPSVAEQLEVTMDLAVMPTYAMTESMPICSNPRFGARKLRSVGPNAGPEMRIMNGHPDNTFLPTGQEGEVVVKGGPVTAGYEFRDHMDCNPNIEGFGDGWLRTGDKGWIDEDGYLYLSGRFKEIINMAGEKISPFEVEEILRKHPKVEDLIAFSAPDVKVGEVVGACCVVKPGQRLTLAELRKYAISVGMASKWLPMAAVYMPIIPKGPTGKPARINLAKRLGMQPLDTTMFEMDHDGVSFIEIKR
jgi:acyl-CoA synthetase (AMP-forming)/AMP-acid ligase II